ncbi:MAG: chromosome segregation protein SMC [Clostridiales bacterium]|nr:chromosome segregation protein SMC [Clostridiales bacterium]
MYLKSIEMLGFKSFPGKTKIAFEEGISCVVGPNGSGKSNIADALRWVLGEQSARNLRGGKQEDVIFSGSKKRKALGMAEVTLLLDNSDGLLKQPFTEISVTRRAIRNASGEFLINNKPCRLKDIQELFVDTGVGVDGISLISQGQINELISARPEERRGFVEEAAGIVKYRNRKREALRKLGETERHLERVGDIINELSGRLQPLHKQAADAELYLVLREEADSCAITLAVRLLGEYENKLRQQLAAVDEQSVALLAADAERLRLAAEREQLKAVYARLDEEVGELAKHFYDLQGQKEKLEARRAVTEGQRVNNESNGERLRAELAELSAAEAMRREEAQQLLAHAQATEREVAELAERVSAGEDDAQSRREAVAYLEEELAKTREQAFDEANRLAQLRNQMHYQRQLWEKNQAAVERLREQGRQIEDELLLAANRKDEIAQYKQAASEETEQMRREMERRQGDIRRQNEALGELAAAETELRYRAHALHVRLNMLEDMQKSYEGFFPGVRALLQAKERGENQLAGLIGVAANLLDVPAEYQAAVETYLGAALQNIICDTQDAARRAIVYLKEKELGRATFLPLDALRVRAKGDMRAVAGLDGVCGLASELVSCAEEIRPAADFLLNQALITRDMDAAVAAAKATNYRLHIVTLDGDMINPGGSLSGGSRNKKGGDLLGKRRQLAVAREEQETLKQQLAEAEQALQAARQELRELNAFLEEGSQGLQDLSNRQIALNHEAEGLLKQAETLKRQQLDINRELAKLADEDIAIEEQQREINESLDGGEAVEQELTERLNELSALLAGRAAALEDEREDVNRQRVELASRQQKLVGQRKSLERIETEIDNIHWDQEAKAADLQQCDKELTEHQNTLAAIHAQILELAELLLNAEQELEGKRHGLSAETARLSELEKAEKEISANCETLREQLHQLEIKKTRMEADCENERQKLTEQFSLTPEQAMELPQVEGSRTAISTRLQQLKKEIAALGTVNVAAIEEYREVDERYRFLSAQREDLLGARAQLYQVIGDIDRIMSSRFRAAFNRLSEEFDKSFRRLFGGGQAALLLTEPEAILETGVDLSVVLPGKKISNYNLLSGGEKALVGIALMFASMAVHSTPFVVMDEVDAALDEPNIDRFTAYLRELARHTQCVMISHRQGTMEAADSLWGVTMEEEGVSKILSVRLQDQVIA